jgi:5-carboxymethyl-2-hydroxymuconate isomerase
MNARDWAELNALIERIDDLLKEYFRETSAERIVALQAEITEATDKLKRTALSLQN